MIKTTMSSNVRIRERSSYDTFLALRCGNSISSKLNIRRKIYDRHKSNSLTNNIVFEAVRRIRYEYINIAGAINTSVS